MQALWKEIVLIAKNVISFSLDLIYDSLDDVISKLKAAIQTMVSEGIEDMQIGYFLKYVSIPDTMNKLLLKDETWADILHVYQQLIIYENKKQTDFLREVDYVNGRLPTHIDSNKAFKLFIQEVNQQMLILYFDAQMKIKKKEKRDKDLEALFAKEE